MGFSLFCWRLQNMPYSFHKIPIFEVVRGYLFDIVRIIYKSEGY